MAIGSGLGGSFGVAAETAYGAYAAPVRFYKIDKADLKKVKNIVQGGGLAAGQFSQDGGRRIVATQAATGSIDVEFGSKGFGLLLNQIFGGTVTPVVQAATTAYLQTHALADNLGKSLTMQNGVPTRGGTVTPYTLLGGKVMSATFKCGLNELLVLTLDVDGQVITEAQTLAAPSYSTGVAPFHFGQMDVKLGTYGAEAHVGGVKGVSVQIARGQQVDGFYAGATVAGTKAEPVTNDWVKITGTIETDFVNKADFLDRYAADSSTSMVISWTGPLIASTYYQQFAITLPMTFFDGDTPSLDSPDVVSVSVPFTSQFDLVNAPVTATYMSTDLAL